ncbi:MAG: hypothetical protein GXX80_10910 [Thermotogaceae bacterium]|nr:hypothetical protein [Thermotogaceae bacterium]
MSTAITHRDCEITVSTLTTSNRAFVTNLRESAKPIFYKHRRLDEKGTRYEPLGIDYEISFDDIFFEKEYDALELGSEVTVTITDGSTSTVYGNCTLIGYEKSDTDKARSASPRFSCRSKT